MKDNLLEILFDLFEKGLSQLKEFHQDQADESKIEVTVNNTPSILDNQATTKARQLRLLTPLEQVKFSKASHQFLVQMQLLGVLSRDCLEQIINTLMFSESRIIQLDETKWLMRKILGENMDYGQLAFLDLILYDKEKALSLH